MSNVSILTGMASREIIFTTFSDGAESCQIPPHIPPESKIRVQINVEDCARDTFRLVLVKDALDSEGFTKIPLTMFYTPHARADRRFTEGSSHSLKCFSKILNSLKFSEVLIADAHSDVSAALIDNVKVISQTQCFKSILPQIKKITNNFILCAPDLGATKKIFDTVMAIGHEDYLQAIKIRDVKTGNIIKCDIQCDDLNGKDVVIVDDLCDGGASFKFLSQKLLTKGCGKVILYTTHGIYSKGLSVLDGYVDYVFCYNLMNRYITRKDIEDFNEE